jgi:hypothetical protein
MPNSLINLYESSSASIRSVLQCVYQKTAVKPVVCSLCTAQLNRSQ